MADVTTSSTGQPQPAPADLAEEARQLRALVEAVPPTTARDRTTARRIEGAAVGLETLAGTRSGDDR